MLGGECPNRREKQLTESDDVLEKKGVRSSELLQYIPRGLLYPLNRFGAGDTEVKRGVPDFKLDRFDEYLCEWAKLFEWSDRVLTKYRLYNQHD